MTIMDELKSRNFSIYGQWAGVLCMFLCFAIGIAELFQLFGHPLLIIWAIISLVSAVLILFIEIPLLMRICPTSEKFDVFMRRFTTNYMRAGFYGILSLVQFLSRVVALSSLIAVAVFLLIAAILYLIAGLQKQEFAGSKTLGGQGVAQMIV